jgi:hypothetical protein
LPTVAAIEAVPLTDIEEGGSETKATLIAGVLEPPPPPPQAARLKASDTRANNCGPLVMVRRLRANIRKLPE